jgi:hypothetical protein
MKSGSVNGGSLTSNLDRSPMNLFLPLIMAGMILWPGEKKPAQKENVPKERIVWLH